MHIIGITDALNGHHWCPCWTWGSNTNLSNNTRSLNEIRHSPNGWKLVLINYWMKVYTEKWEHEESKRHEPFSDKAMIGEVDQMPFWKKSILDQSLTISQKDSSSNSRFDTIKHKSREKNPRSWSPVKIPENPITQKLIACAEKQYSTTHSCRCSNLEKRNNHNHKNSNQAKKNQNATYNK